ncbi:hypothetical protein CLOM_g15353 [Closterium sp. NIES-68]|nr:hypothetical protein CLOM_g15353 [Closterium sp. NIES-68]GJP69970.1 hypothetical protein CLOP_g962 [Closterium sp. NIES-67]
MALRQTACLPPLSALPSYPIAGTSLKTRGARRGVPSSLHLVGRSFQQNGCERSFAPSHATSHRALTSTGKCRPGALAATWSGEESQRHVIHEAAVPRNGMRATRRVKRPTWRAHATPSSSSSSSSSSSPTPSSSSAPLSLYGEDSEDMSSPRSIAAGLHRRYRAVVDSGYRDHLKEFARAAVAAYAVGCTEEGLRRELTALLTPTLKAASPPTVPAGAAASPPATLERIERVEAVGLPATAAEERDVSSLSFPPSVTSATISTELRQEVHECVLWVAIVFVTIAVLPQPVITRWALSKAASPDSHVQWQGFCSLIANAYYTQGMAWYSVGRLQMEQMAVAGVAEPAAVVADRMRLVFTTLEYLTPHWPSR